MKSNNQNHSTISHVMKHDLCTGCGTCVALCPKEAIELKVNNKKGIYVPELDDKKCNHCGVCGKVCPGYDVDSKELNLEIFGKEPEDMIIGNYLNCYIGNADDFNIQYDSSSGGIITALLIYAIEEGLIDGALVTRMKKEKPLETESFIARKREEIIESSKSKYCPVPANIALKDILNAKEDEKFAVVGLPCHIHGIRKAQKQNNKLREKIILCFGICCSHTDSFLATEFILNWFGIEKKNVKRIEYRGRGWPGSMLIELKNGHSKIIPYEEFITIHLLQTFSPFRCAMCYDGTNELADISLGDAWGIELIDKNGTSLCIPRTDIGEKVIQKSINNGFTKLDEIEGNKLIGTQGLFSESRIRSWKAKQKIIELFGKDSPKYNNENLNDYFFDPKYIDYFKIIILGLHNRIIAKKVLWNYYRFIFPMEKKILKKIFKN